jgi:hypothetical protein
MDAKEGIAASQALLATVEVFHQANREGEIGPQIPSSTVLRI